jgi:AraC family transcriptional regulator, arabinose operon regulatory protein
MRLNPNTERHLRPHFHEDRRDPGMWALEYLSAGTYRFFADGDWQTLQAPVLTLVAPQVSYRLSSLESGEPWEECWCLFEPRPHWLPWLNWPAEQPPGLWRLRLGTAAVAAQVSELFLETIRHRFGGMPLAEDYAANAFERLLLLLRSLGPGGQPRLDARVAQATALLSDGACTPAGIARLAREVHLSPSRLAHLFRAQVGDTPRRFQERCRLERAASLLLASTLSVKEVAERGGFSSQQYFCARFRRFAGMTPRAYRQRCRP